MGDAKEREVNTQPAVNYTDNFFNALPVDARFNKVELLKFEPTSGGVEDAPAIRFHLEKREAPQCYLISKTLLQLDLTITKADGASLPTTGLTVAGVNNTLHSLFSEVSTSINGQNISGSKLMYNYKAYLGTLLTFDSEVKNSTLQMQGWANDKARDMGATATNSGFSLRSQFMREDDIISNPYRADGCTFIGKLYHELHTCDKPLPPHTSVDFYFTREKSEFSLMSRADDSEKYKAVVKNIKIFVPVAWLSEPMYKEIQVRFAKQTMKYHFRRWSILTFGIGMNKRETVSESIFGESENPTRIFFAIVESKSQKGDIHTNPYDFGRKWGYTTNSASVELGLTVSNQQTMQMVSDIDKKLDQTISQVNSKFDLIMKKLEGSEPPTGTPATRRSSVQLDRRSSMYEKLSSFFRRSSQTEENPELDDEEQEALMALLRGKHPAPFSPSPSRQSTSTAVDPPLVGETDPPLVDEVEESGLQTPNAWFWLTKCQLEIDGSVIGK
jgi:hypothetical protein